jgi:multidrug efflux pump subunit AcrA (membrane-fusion protein)
MSTQAHDKTRKFDRELTVARRLLAEEGFYQLRDKKRTTEQVHELASVVEELVLHLEQAERSLAAQRARADELEDKVQLAQSRGFSGPDSYYGNVQERMAELEQSAALLERQREDERERLQTVIDQRQEEWERAEGLANVLREIVSREIDIDEIRALANGALSKE